MVEAQQLVLAAWMAIAAVLVGFGLLARRAFGGRIEHASELWPVLWTGWALLVCFLQFWHLFVPVDDRARFAVAAVALLGWMAAGVSPWRALRRALPGCVPGLLLIALGAWWLSNRSLAGPSFGDTGLYLVPMVHWDKSFAIVPGLANLYVPFGHNLSYFLYGALLDGGPFTERIYPLVNTALAMAIAARGLMACPRLLRRKAGRIAGDLFHAAALVPVVDLAFSHYALTSPMPDTGVYLVGIVLAGELVELLSDDRPSRAAMIRVAFLSAAAITIKLSIAGFSVATAAVALAWWLWRTRPIMADALKATLLAGLAALVPVGGWMLRNAISSGYPLYPAALFPLPVDWIARVDATAWIQKPMAMAPMWTIFRDWAWWQTRLLSLGWMEADSLRPAAMVAAGGALFLLLRPLSWWRGREAMLPIVVLAAPLAGFFFCFSNTPMPRYQGATVWILGLELFVLALAPPLAKSGRLPRVIVVLLVVAGVSAPLARGAQPWLPLHDFESAAGPRVHEQTLASGLVVGVPENSVCWYAPMPCTPEPHPGLRLREPGNLAAGFAIDENAVSPSE